MENNTVMHSCPAMEIVGLVKSIGILDHLAGIMLVKLDVHFLTDNEHLKKKKEFQEVRTIEVVTRQDTNVEKYRNKWVKGMISLGKGCTNNLMLLTVKSIINESQKDQVNNQHTKQTELFHFSA